MVRRTILCMLLACAMLLCGCAKAEEATTEPATVPPATAAPVTTAPEPEPEPETVISYDFHLEELPDVGKHRPKSTGCFYDAPLREFQPSDRYGTLIPYWLIGRDAAYDTIDSCGLMTADGKIVTGCIYKSIYTEQLGGETFYFAESNVFRENPETIDWEEDEEGASAAFSRAEEYYDENVFWQIISADGKNCMTSRKRPYAFTDPESGDSLICFVQYRFSDDEYIGTLKDFTVYGADLDLIADLRRDLRPYKDAQMIDAGKNSFTLECSRYQGSGESTERDLLFYEDGELTQILEMGSEYADTIAGGLVICKKRLYDRNGRTVFTLDSSDEYRDTMVKYDPSGDCFYLSNAYQGRLVKINRAGDVLAETDVPVFHGYLPLTLCGSGDKAYVVIPRREGDEELEGYTVYDSALRKVFELDGEELHNCDFCCVNGVCVFLTVNYGETTVMDITGKTLATIPFAFDDISFNNYSDDSRLLYLYQYYTGTDSAVYSFADHSVSTIPNDPGRNNYPEFFNQKLLVFRKVYSKESNDKREYVFVDSQTGTTLQDDISAFHAYHVNGKNYFTYIKNDTVYVCGENLNVIAALYDDLYV